MELISKCKYRRVEIVGRGEQLLLFRVIFFGGVARALFRDNPAVVAAVGTRLPRYVLARVPGSQNRSRSARGLLTIAAKCYKYFEEIRTFETVQRHPVHSM